MRLGADFFAYRGSGPGKVGLSFWTRGISEQAAAAIDVHAQIS